MTREGTLDREPSESIDPQGFAWPVVELDPVRTMRALAAGMPHVALRETVLEAPFERVWDFIADLEGSTPQYESTVASAKILERDGDRLILKGRLTGGPSLRFSVVLRPGWCIMRSRLGEIGMAARPENSSQTRFVHFEGSRLFGRLARPFFHWNIGGDFRRLRRLLE